LSGTHRNCAKLEKANKLIFVKDYLKAGKLIEELIRSPEYKDDILIHLRRVELATKLNQLDDLQKEYEEAIARDSTDRKAHTCYILLELHSEFEDLQQTVLRLQTLLGTFGQDPAIYYCLGFAMELEGNWKRAQYNYEQCVQLDPSWYPAYFGLSQIHYQLGDPNRGDHYFFLFEEAAPYNVYGNFETHRKLSNEFLDEENFAGARKAITTLSEWWIDNKGHCPLEIQVFESFSLGRIAGYEGQKDEETKKNDQGQALAKRILADKGADEGILFFVAKALEEFGFLPLAIEFYKAVLRLETRSPDVVQRIGSHFFSMGEYQLASELFEEAYRHHPDHPEVRFCWLVSRLRNAGVNVEEYLLGKERLKTLLDPAADRVELLSQLHSLVAMYDQDPDVQAHMGDVYLRLGNRSRADQHYEKMFELDGDSLVTRLKYGSYKMQAEDFDAAKKVLETLPEETSLGDQHLCEIFWLKANYESQRQNYDEALRLLNRILTLDPWNVSYLIQKIICLSLKAQDTLPFHPIDSVVRKLHKGDEDTLNWDEFAEMSRLLSQANMLELVYERERVRFLYTDADEQALHGVIAAAKRYDASKSTYDFLRLLNTNFDSPDIYWALGLLYKELWQLETSRVWFDQMLLHPQCEDRHKAKAYMELADSYIWEGNEFDKAVEFAKLSLDLNAQPDHQIMRVIAHALLKTGQVRQAEAYLEDLDGEDDVEVVYLKGLVKYRNGAFENANELWKPLLTTRTESLRFHNIKQEIMKYYFDKKPYQGTN
jgi:tetratricopeptide (TPR) repeat protein